MGKAKYYVMLTLTCLIWGATPASGKLTVDTFSPLLLTSCRFAIIATILFIYLILTKQYKELRPSRSVLLLTVAMGFMGMTVHNGLLFLGLRYTTATNTALIESIGPTITTVLAFLFIGERLNKFGWVGIFISCFGALMIISKGHIEVFYNFSFNIGDIYILLCEAAWSSYVIIGWKVQNRLSTIAVTAWSGLFGSLLCLLVGALTNSLWLGELTERALFGFSYITFASGLFAFIAWNWSAVAVGASKAGSFVYLVPLTGALLGVFILNEVLSLAQMLGAILIVLGMIFTVRSKVKIVPHNKSKDVLERYPEMKTIHEQVLKEMQVQNQNK